MHTHWSQFVPNNYVNPTSEDIKLYIIIIITTGTTEARVVGEGWGLWGEGGGGFQPW